MKHQPDRRALVLKLRLAVALSLAAAAVVGFVVISRTDGQSETSLARVGSNVAKPASVGHSGSGFLPGSDRSNEGASDGEPAPGPASLGVNLTPPLATWLSLGDPFGASRGEGRYHAGLDFDVGHLPIAVLAACNGPVSVDDSQNYGLRISLVCSPDLTLLYAYLGGVSVETSQQVSNGQPIGLTDPALGILHFEIRHKGKPVDPARYIEALSLAPPEAAVTPPPTVPRPTQVATTTPATSRTISTATSPPPSASLTPAESASIASSTPPPTSTSTPTPTQTNTPTSTSTPRTPSRGGTAVPGH